MAKMPTGREFAKGVVVEVDVDRLDLRWRFKLFFLMIRLACWITGFGVEFKGGNEQ